ncbi:MAG TPA: TIGR03619 family F420-dependent LLM class oxidoreductase [Trebonia sp.]|jgi:probable F420-dependent oxidoreductase|nr:TIGR03619 family F420-dependent LLM class oxidoreductase [Trebonia sp.]
MKLGFGLPQRNGVSLRRDITGMARMAETAGFASLWTYERLLFPVQPSDGMYGMPGLPWPPIYEECADALTVMAVAAAVTESLEMGAGVLVATLHPPVRLAKTLATIDQVSGGGRLIAGFGTGWSTDEARAAGASFADRGRYLDETLDVLEAAWGPDPVSYQGESAILDRVIFRPKPVSRIPVILGAPVGGIKALDRIARRADGWMSAAIPLPAMTGAWQRIQETAAGHGRDAAAMKLICRGNITFTDAPAGKDRYPFVGTKDQIVEDIVACAEAGVDEVVIDVFLQDPISDIRQMVDTALEIHERAIAAGV